MDVFLPCVVSETLPVPVIFLHGLLWALKCLGISRAVGLFLGLRTSGASGPMGKVEASITFHSPDSEASLLLQPDGDKVTGTCR